MRPTMPINRHHRRLLHSAESVEGLEEVKAED
jgi:hypothetical protein